MLLLSRAYTSLSFHCITVIVAAVNKYLHSRHLCCCWQRGCCSFSTSAFGCMQIRYHIVLQTCANYFHQRFCSRTSVPLSLCANNVVTACSLRLSQALMAMDIMPLPDGQCTSTGEKAELIIKCSNLSQLWKKIRGMWFTLSTCGLYTWAVYSLKNTAQLVVHTCGWKLRTHTLPELTTCRIAFILVPNRCFSYSPYSTNCPSAMSASNSCFEMKWYSRPSTSPSPIGRLVSTRFISDTHLAVLTIVAQQANTSSSSKCSYTNKNIIKVT